MIVNKESNFEIKIITYVVSKTENVEQIIDEFFRLTGFI